MNSTATLPPLKSTIPGVTRPYRLFTRDHVSWLTRPQGASVVLDGWGTSYTTSSAWEGCELHAYRVPDTSIKHPLHGTRYATSELAHRMAFEAGLTGVMVYEDQR